MASITEIMNLELDADTQLLRKHYIEDSAGNLTNQGKDVLLRVLYLDNKQAIIEKLKAVDAYHKANPTDEDDE